ncbi:MAG: hypothetical protein HY077_09235 [Elusimicrobia bacterium]|nr:hypothetical protein [Elusimicrobiota bacterium]
MALFVKIERGIVDKKVFDEFVPAHKEYVQKLNEHGHKVRSGYWADYGGGMMLFEATDITQARAIVREDPLVRNGCVSWELHEWKLVSH